MMRKFIFALALVLLLASVSAAANRETLSISGILKTADGNYLNGNYSIDFNIFPTAGGSSIYDENHNGSQASQVRVTNGYFSVTLGDTNVLPINFFTADYNLAMNIGSAGWLSPTIRLNSAPNALTASRALDFNVAQDLNVTRNTQIKGTLTVTGATKVLGTSALTLDGGRLNAVDLNVSGVATFATALTDGNLANITTAGKVKASAISDLNVQYARLNANNTFANNVAVTGSLDLTTTLGDGNLSAITTAGKVKLSALDTDLNLAYARLNADNVFANSVVFTNTIGGNTSNVILVNDTNALTLEGGSLNVGNDLNVADDTTLSDQLTVTGATKVLGTSALTLDGGTLNATDLNIQTAANLRGDVLFKGQIGGNTSNVILVNDTNTLTLEGGRINTVDLNVSGTLTVATITGLASTTDLNVQNNVLFKGQIGGNTSNVILVNDTNNLTLEGGTLNAADLNIQTAAISRGQLSVYGVLGGNTSNVILVNDTNALTLEGGSLNVGNDLNVADDTTLSDQLTVTGATKILGTSALTLDGGKLNVLDLNVSHDLNVAHDLNIGTTLASGHALTFHSVAGLDNNMVSLAYVAKSARRNLWQSDLNMGDFNMISLLDGYSATRTRTGLFVTGVIAFAGQTGTVSSAIINDVNASGQLGGDLNISVGMDLNIITGSKVTISSTATSADINSRVLWVDGNIAMKLGVTWYSCNVNPLDTNKAIACVAI